MEDPLFFLPKKTAPTHTSNMFFFPSRFDPKRWELIRTSDPNGGNLGGEKKLKSRTSWHPFFPRWWFQTFFIFTLTWGNDPI